MLVDEYQTIKHPAQAQITVKRSKFIAFIHPVTSAEETKTIVDATRKEFFDARHVCWAYVIGYQGEVFRANDDGEPSGTAGKPILGQIRSAQLTNVIILVVRYFGGTKLGTSGLISAYKEAAFSCIQDAETVIQTINHTIQLSFGYDQINSVMVLVKEFSPKIVNQSFDLQCQMTLQIRESLLEQLTHRLSKIDNLTIKTD